MKSRKLLALIGLLLALVGTLSACRQSTTDAAKQSPKQIKIVASVNFYGEVAKAVVGKTGHVTSIIDNANVDPHDFEATTADAKAIGTAQLIIYNGLGYDDWMSRAAQNKAANAQVIRVGEDVQHFKDGANEHVWYAPGTMANLASQLAQHLSKIDPKHRQQYQANARRYQNSLKPMKTMLSQIKHHANNKAVAVSEPVFDYALKAMGYRVTNPAFALAIENGTDPSPTAISQLQSDIKHHRLAFFVENTQSDSNIVGNMVSLAKRYRVPVVKVTETQPANKSYLKWMLSQYQQVEKIQNQ